MDCREKLKRLSAAARFEPAEEVPPQGGSCGLPGDPLRGMIHQAVLPGGRRIPLLKTLLTSACERNCLYCPFRAGRDFRRVTFTPDELAALCDQMHRAGLIQGVFLSSGLVGGGVRTQDRLLATAELLRRRYRFRGYIHLKLMPGAEQDQVAQAMRLADRVSVNLEAPNQARLARLAPQKALIEELVRPLRYAAELRRRWGRGPSQTTQFVVGAAGESDRELLRTTDYLRRTVGLARAYFSAFRPIPGTPLEGHPPTPPLREHRLYQADFLLRDYGFRAEELVYDAQGNLPLEADPKLVWARRHLAQAPVELNRADREMLLRVPGIGPRGADKLLQARRRGRLRSLADLRRLGVAADRAAPFILLDGRRPDHQLPLFSLADD